MMSKCVSTIPDECKGVGAEIGTATKRKTTPRKWNEDIVSADGDIGITRVEQRMEWTLMVLDKRKTVGEIFVR